MPASPGCARGRHFAARMHQPAVADRGQQEGERARSRPSTRVRRSHLRERDRVARPERHVLEGAAVLAERDLPFGASVEIVEDGRGRRRRASGRRSSTQTTRGEATLRDALLIYLSRHNWRTSTSPEHS